MNPVFEAYLKEADSVKEFFGQPLKPDWRQPANRINSQSRRFALDELIAQNQGLSNEKAKRYLEWLKNEKPLIVITGQQLGIFISPLYTVLKALTTVALAEHLNRSLPDLKFVPVFWLEGEDHDFEEINSAFFFDKSNQLTKFTIENKSGDRLPVSQRILPGDMREKIDELENRLQTTEFTQPLFELLREFYKPGKLWINSFKEHLNYLLRELGILTFDPADVAVKQKSLPFFELIIEENERIVQYFEQQTNSLKSEGYPVQVKILEDRAYLFYKQNGSERLPVLKSGGNKFRIGDSGEELSEKSFKKLIRENPDWISSTALTRPLWQSYLLPVISYVAGAAEIAYWAQTRAAFDFLKIPMPHLQPRFSATLIEPRISRLLRKYGLEPESADRDVNRWIKEAIGQKYLNPLWEEGTSLRRVLKEFKKKYEDFIQDIDSTLKPVVSKSFNNMEKTLENLENRLTRSAKQKETLMVNQLQTIHQFILPRGELQERILSSLYFSNKFGDDWLQKVYEKIDLETWKHDYVYL